jgi:type I restriction enzyme, S subunit
MNVDFVLANFNRLSDSRGAVKRLRRFVFDLAVRGKLVLQDPKEEAASELLKRIGEERARLNGEAQSKKVETWSGRRAMRGDYEIPKNWKWVSLGETVMKHVGGGTPSKAKPAYWGGDIPWASVKDIGKDKYVDETVDHITEAGLADSSSNIVAPGSLIVVTRMGLGKISINRVPLAINQDLRALYLSSMTVIDYHYIFLKTYGFEGTGLTVKGIRVEELLNIPFPLPPLGEQHRIVEKVNELMMLCDRLEAAREERDSRWDRFAKASLNRLGHSMKEGGPDKFREALRFDLKHFSTTTDRVAHIPLVREAILDLAVRSELTLRDSGDEPASAFLAKIRTRQEELITSGKIPRRTSRLPSGQPGLTFTPPAHWEAIYLGSVCNLVTSGSRGWAEYYSDTGPNFIRAQNIRFGRLRLDDLAKVKPPNMTEGSRTQVSVGDLLMVITGAGVTNPALVDRELGETYVSQHVALIKPTETSVSRWLLLCLMAQCGARAQLVKRAYGAGKPGLNLDNIRSLIIPFPPLAEQHRITAKVEKLMALCDGIEEQLASAETSGSRLLEAVLSEALNGDVYANTSEGLATA